MSEGRDPNARQRAVDAAMATIDRALDDAKRGNFTGIDDLIALVSRDEWEVADAASEALERIGSSRAIDALAQKARLRVEPIYALASIGTPAVVPHLVALLADEEPEFREHARRALHRVLGDRVSDLLDFEDTSTPSNDEQVRVADWWAVHGSDYDPDVAYDRGEPIDMTRDVETMVGLSSTPREQENSMIDAFAKKMTDFTGHGIENACGPDLARRWQEWWRANASRFERGKRYFHGHSVD